MLTSRELEGAVSEAPKESTGSPHKGIHVTIEDDDEGRERFRNFGIRVK